MRSQSVTLPAGLGRSTPATRPQTTQAVDQDRRPPDLLEGFVEEQLGSHDSAMARLLRLPLRWLRRRRLRLELAEVSDAQLRDVGLDPAHVRHETTKLFWMG